MEANAPTSTPSEPTNGTAKNKGGGGLQALFTNSLTVWIDDQLLRALELATATEKERQAIIVRRWLRRAAISENYYPKG